jgi:hypothetical protein
VVPYEDQALGFGALLVKASSPVSAVARFANRTAGGDFAAAVPLLAASSSKGRFLVSSDTRLRQNVFVFNRGVAGTITIKTFNASGNVVGVQGCPRDHRSLILPNAGADGASGGRIEYSGTEGTALYVWPPRPTSSPVTDAQDAAADHAVAAADHPSRCWIGRAWAGLDSAGEDFRRRPGRASRLRRGGTTPEV